MNSICLSGRVVEEAEIRFTVAGVPICRSVLEVKRPYIKDVFDYIVIELSKNNAVRFESHTSKGTFVEVRGALINDVHYDNNGNTVHSLKVRVDSWEFAQYGKKENKEKDYKETQVQVETDGNSDSNNSEDNNSKDERKMS